MNPTHTWFTIKYRTWCANATFITTIDGVDVWRYKSGRYYGVQGDSDTICGGEGWVLEDGRPRYPESVVNFCLAHMNLSS